MLMYPKMINMENSCTVIEDFVPATIELMEKGATGIFNMTNIGALNHVEIMTIYKENVDPSFQINVMSPEEQAAKDNRHGKPEALEGEVRRAGDDRDGANAHGSPRLLFRHVGKGVFPPLEEVDVRVLHVGVVECGEDAPAEDYEVG